MGVEYVLNTLFIIVVIISYIYLMIYVLVKHFRLIIFFKL